MKRRLNTTKEKQACIVMEYNYPAGSSRECNDSKTNKIGLRRKGRKRNV